MSLALRQWEWFREMHLCTNQTYGCYTRWLGDERMVNAPVYIIGKFKGGGISWHHSHDPRNYHHGAKTILEARAECRAHWEKYLSEFLVPATGGAA